MVAIVVHILIVFIVSDYLAYLVVRKSRGYDGERFLTQLSILPFIGTAYYYVYKLF